MFTQPEGGPGALPWKDIKGSAANLTNLSVYLNKCTEKNQGVAFGIVFELGTPLNIELQED